MCATHNKTPHINKSKTTKKWYIFLHLCTYSLTMLKYTTNPNSIKRMITSNCKWHHETKLLTDYHNSEWGYPCTNDQELFQKISLETMQAGLSWRTILEKKHEICKCFKHFDLKKVASFNTETIEKILSNPKIIRRLHSPNNFKIRIFVLC